MRIIVRYDISISFHEIIKMLCVWSHELRWVAKFTFNLHFKESEVRFGKGN